MVPTGGSPASASPSPRPRAGSSSSQHALPSGRMGSAPNTGRAKPAPGPLQGSSGGVSVGGAGPGAVSPSKPHMRRPGSSASASASLSPAARAQHSARGLGPHVQSARANLVTHTSPTLSPASSVLASLSLGQPMRVGRGSQEGASVAGAPTTVQQRVITRVGSATLHRVLQRAIDEAPSTVVLSSGTSVGDVASPGAPGVSDAGASVGSPPPRAPRPGSSPGGVRGAGAGGNGWLSSPPLSPSPRSIVSRIRGAVATHGVAGAGTGAGTGAGAGAGEGTRDAPSPAHLSLASRRVSASLTQLHTLVHEVPQSSVEDAQASLTQFLRRQQGLGAAGDPHVSLFSTSPSFLPLTSPPQQVWPASDIEVGLASGRYHAHNTGGSSGGGAAGGGDGPSASVVSLAVNSHIPVQFHTYVHDPAPPSDPAARTAALFDTSTRTWRYRLWPTCTTTPTRGDFLKLIEWWVGIPARSPCGAPCAPVLSPLHRRTLSACCCTHNPSLPWLRCLPQVSLAVGDCSPRPER
jgi:hypothetical protein